MISFIGVLIFFISKKNNNLRFYINYRKLNTITIKNRYLLFLIIEILNRLYGFQIFTKFNLKNIYYKIRIKKGDK